MGWIAIYKDTFQRVAEDDGVGRPVDDGNDDKLAVIAQEDFGHKIAIDLRIGVIYIDYENLAVQNQTIEISNPKSTILICEETNIVGELFHVKQELVPLRDEQGRKILQDGKFAEVRNDIVTPLVWRPIRFTRWTNFVPAKVIGAQTTTPKVEGERNVKKMIILFADGRIGID